MADRAPKRARTEAESPASSPAPPAAAAAAASISLERLPGDVLSRILQLLPLRTAFAVRRVSRAIRDAVESTAFDGGTLHVACRAEGRWSAALDKLEHFVRDGRLKGGDLSVRVECSGELRSGGGAQPAGLLAALAGRCRRVCVRFVFAGGAELAFDRHVRDVLGALAPGGAAGPLQELELLSSVYQTRFPHTLKIPEECLAPLSGLQALRLADDAPPSAETVAAIAARLPSLRRLRLCVDAKRPEAIGRLAPLRSLEQLVLHTSSLQPPPHLRGPGLSFFPARRPPGAGQWGASLRPGDLAALARMPELERVTGYPSLDALTFGGGSECPELAEFLRAPRLAAAELSLFNRSAPAPLAAALAARGSALQSLGLRVTGDALASLPALVAASEPVLTGLELELRAGCSWEGMATAALASWSLRPAMIELAASLARCPRFGRLAIRADVAAPVAVAFAADLGPLAALGRGGCVRLEVSARLRRPGAGSGDVDEHLAAARAAFAAALPAVRVLVEAASP
eukprot:tig00000057_g78.t2